MSKLLDYTGLSLVIEKIRNLLNGKVDKENGKGLSTNDFSDEYKEIVDNNNEAITNIVENITTEINAQSTNAQYPTAKSVYDFVDETTPIIEIKEW